MATTAASPEQFLSFGELLRYLRRRAGLTQDELGRAIGYGREQVVRFEKDQRKPDIDVVRLHFIEALGLHKEVELAARLIELAAVAKAKTTADMVLARSLPTPVTRLFGRDHDIAEVVRSLGSGKQLLTLTGAGGVGKTRLALEVARQAEDNYPDGVAWVELASITDPAQVVDALLQALGTQAQARSTIESVCAVLSAKQELIVLDNCEHLIEACASLAAELRQTCPHLSILATSREALGILGETVHHVPSLVVPDSQSALLPDVVSHFPAVQLFLDRAEGVRPGFELGLANALNIVHICQQLDGIPLAIELAATCVATLSVQQIADKLNDRFDLLDTGNRVALPRQRTLRATMDWSYDLLSIGERGTLQWLSVFVGGWSYDAAEAMLKHKDSAPPTSAIATLKALVSKSLVIADEIPIGTRYHMLETVRQYAEEKLIASNQGGLVRQLHANYFVQLAEQADPLLRSDQQLRWYACLDVEQPNFRAALSYAIERRDAEVGQRLFTGLFFYWIRRARWAEGVRWAELILPLDEHDQSRSRAWTLLGAAFLAARTNDLERTQLWGLAALPLGASLGDDRFLAFANFGYSYLETDHAKAIDMLQKAIALARRANSQWDVANLTSILGDRLRLAGQLVASEAHYRNSVRLFREIGDQEGIPYPLGNLGRLMFLRGEYVAAKLAFADCIAMCRNAGFVMGLADWLWQLAWVDLRTGDLVQAEARLEEAYEVNQQIGNQDALAAIAVVTVELFAIQGRWHEVARLAGSLAKLERHLWVINMSTDEVLAEMARFEADARYALGEVAFSAAHAEGSTWPLASLLERI